MQMKANKQDRFFCKPKKSVSIDERFSRFVEKRGDDECWEWQGSRHGKGYGHFRLNGRMEKAHRVAPALDGRPALPEQEVLHSCDNPPCVNPRHLSAGTIVQNQHDSWARHWRAGVQKLSAEDVLNIRAAIETQQILAGRFGVSQSQISVVKRGKSGNAILLQLAGG